MYFEEEQQELSKGETLTSSNKTTNNLTFAKIDTGDFLFWDWKKDGQFIGKFIRHWTEDKDLVKGLEFLEHGTGQRYILSENYKLMEFFVMNPRPEYNYNDGLFQITYKGEKELSGGKTISLFEFGYCLV